ncbi:GH25 family lysozyme [Levilactobacillus humaensis]|uniref:GH25 family lysozyme n=1 Tax=Levilactobacillus humaensis TaxID=2950375 RepID=UPI0021C44AF6|nr:GH25 family lysozyme [Levilactobacillus humaensis]
MALNGIDVASYQAGYKVGKAGGSFVIVKATQGTNYLNPEYGTQVKQTLAAGKKLGIYHFAQGGSAVAEAKYFLSKAKKSVGKAILVLDFEGSAVNRGVAWAKTWLDYVYQQTGVRPLIYMGLADENRLNWSPVAKNYGLWIAQYNNYNRVSGYHPRSMYGSVKHWKTIAIFQYTSAGKLSGWGGNLDFNVFYGSKATWDKYAKTGDKSKAKSKKKTYLKAAKQVQARAGINRYYDTAFKRKENHYKKGTVFDIAKVVKYGKITRLKLANGMYITANASLVKKLK